MPASLPAPGSIVWIRQQRWRVERAARDRNVVRLDVSQPDRRLTFLAPFDRPHAPAATERLPHVRPQHARARLAGALARTGSLDTIAAIVRARVNVLPHQLEPVLAVLGGARRVLIADEVGLGKTVQAGIILAELVRRHSSFAALVVVPASLAAQWRQELASRFGLDVTAAGPTGFATAGRDAPFGANPWGRAGLWIASLDYLKQPHVLDAIPRAPWDVVIVDEAHDACGDSLRHDACHEIARRARVVVLLTGTPHSGDAARFDRLLRLGRLSPDEPLAVFRRTRADIGGGTARRIAWRTVSLNAAEVDVLTALAGYEQAVLRRAVGSRRDGAVLLLSIFRKRALSTWRALDRSLERRLAWIRGPDAAQDLDWIQPSLGFDSGTDDLDETTRMALMTDVGLPAAQERLWLSRLRTLTATATRRESKIATLAALVTRVREPVVVFTEFRDSLDAIVAAIGHDRRVLAIHGGQTMDERQRAIDAFRLGAADTLVATDVAGQGLNLHHRCRWIVSFELPWNPTRLEQRIGRVDRIGQTRRVHATLLAARHPAETGLLMHLARRVVAARQSLGPTLLADLAPPAERDMAMALIADAPGPAPATATTVEIATRWRRRAQAAARMLTRRRALAMQWRTDGMMSRRGIWTDARRMPAFARQAAAGRLVFFVVPIVDGNGVEIERHALVLALPSEPSARTALDPIAWAAISGIARTQLAPRLRQLARRLAPIVHAQALADAAVTLRLRAMSAPEKQPGLFEGRAARAAALTESAELAAEAEARAAEVDRNLALEIGRPILVLLVDHR
ncbi:MAG TPA: helicase-related protein [Vicinamibacterales bacterium]|nr:helicase-related protein [Vicinamibacterales bacterium]